MNIDLDDDVDEYVPSGKARVTGNRVSSNNRPLKQSPKTPSKAAPSGKNKKLPGKELKGSDIYKTALMKFRKAGSRAQYLEIAELLTPYTAENPDNELALKILGFSLLQTGNLEDARLAFHDVFSRNPNDAETLNAQAYFSLSDGILQDSINFLLDAIYIDQNHPQLKKNLEKIKNIKDIKVFLNMTKPSDFIFIQLPKEPASELILIRIKAALSSPTAKLGVIACGVILLGVLGYLFYPAIVNFSEDNRFTRGLGKGRVTHVTIQDIDKLTEERKLYNIKLTDAEIKQKFEMVKSFLDDKKRNRAVITINELLNSNASEGIRERVLILKDFIPDPDIQNIDYSPQVQDVLKTPFLYQDVAVRWDGTIANLEHKERRETVFDLLIHFVDTATVEGIAETHFDGFEKIRNGEKVALFGKIAGITVDNRIVIRGLQIQSLENK